ncbi:hypothetical protein BOTBODRAFT_174195 [Botryobasidium botryosum FD-172 SS1]|uniref:Altered inheritance of mitochondria protein 9, mitochondrial n=1 Tax=Botryobasidium botryosum (strain FD-172 SS1) TaxID=930990 RepID=A0A067MT03_BOTB1|nr:hypothetical protein BOTBODRAFT_174195 [Botryobasidium botryosum FD-172 SS1]
MPRTKFIQSSAKVEDVKYEDFYRCSTKRWLYNEKKQLALYYRKFNVPALQDTAARAVGAERCVSIEKIAEGSFNKIFLLRFDNSKEAIARISCPIAEPSHLVVLSEVATLEFCRTRLNLPVPQVYAWNSRASDSDVGAAYIIMEQVPGVSLSERWLDLDAPKNRGLTFQMIDVEKKFSEIQFSQIGSLYFKEDVERELQERPLYAAGVPGDEASERFRIGPTLQREFWRRERVDMTMDRGPWPDFQSYGIALAKCEQQWLQTFARTRAPGDPFRRSDEDESPQTHIAMLDRFLSIVPFVKPPADILPLTLWHPDLHDGNVMVERDGLPEITGIIDWQNMWIGPRFMRAPFSPVFAYGGTMIDIGITKPELPPGYDELSAEDQAEARTQLQLVGRHKIYEFLVRKHHPQHSAVLSYPHLRTLVTLFQSAPRTWTDGIAPLRQALLEVAHEWEALAGPGVPCPLTFGQDELEAHAEEFRRMQVHEARLRITLDVMKLDPDGVVDPERYKSVKEALAKIRPFWDDKEIGPWPFQDGGWSSFF